MKAWHRIRTAAAVAACVAGTAAVPAPAQARVASAGELAAGEDYLRSYMTDTKAPGLAWAVIRGDEVIRQGAWGVDGNGQAMTARTPFLLGSTSKSFTGLAVAQLAEAGRIGLDTTAATYLPWLRLGDADTARTVTVRQLLNHTSGLPPVWNSDLTDRYDNRPGGLARSVRDLAGLRPTVPAGTHQYSDANYMILGALVEQVTGDTFGAYLRRHVLDPLGMTRSAATADEAAAIGIPAGHRYHLGRAQRFAAPFDTAGVPYGFLAASVEDLSHYAIAQLNGGRYGDARILSAESTTRMQAGTADTGHGTYGLGWRNSTLDGIGARVVWHAGATPDYFTHIVLIPESNLAVVLMTNVYGLHMDPVLSGGAFNLARILHGGTPAAASADPIHTWALIGLPAIAATLLAALIRSWFRLSGARPRRSRGRTIAVTAAWTGGCAALAAAGLWVVPALFGGAGLAKLLLWMPDVGQAVIAMAAAAGALALTRLGMGIYALVKTPRSP